jgi:hypothetical protein
MQFALQLTSLSWNGFPIKKANSMTFVCLLVCWLVGLFLVFCFVTPMEKRNVQ